MENDNDQWKLTSLSGDYIANVSIPERQQRTDDDTGRPFELIKISSPSVHLDQGKYILVNPDGEKTKVEIFDEPVGGVYPAGKIS